MRKAGCGIFCQTTFNGHPAIRVAASASLCILVRAGALHLEGTMQRFDRNYILLGLSWVILGMVFGTWLGASNHLNYANTHAHIGVLGFVTSVLFGLLHWAYPALGKSRLALPQLAIYQIGVALLIIGKFNVDGGVTIEPLLIAGSLITILGTVLMLVMFVRHGNKAVA
jgi:hypothetical protein